MTASTGSTYTPFRLETVTNGENTRILIHGEADIADVNHLDAALTAIHLDGSKSVLLDVSGLDFFDVTVLRRLIVFARRVKQTGRDITTCGTTPMQHEVAHILDLQDDLGLP